MSRDDHIERVRLLAKRRREEAARERVIQDVFSLRLEGPPEPAESRRHPSTPASQQMRRASPSRLGQLRVPRSQQSRSSPELGGASPGRGPQGDSSAPHRIAVFSSGGSRSSSSSPQGPRSTPSSNRDKSSSSACTTPSARGRQRSGLWSDLAPDDHVPGCHCFKCDEESHSSLNLGVASVNVQWKDKCVPGCRCIFCDEKSKVLRNLRLEESCRNDGHILPVIEQCGSPSCVCRNGCTMHRCVRCYPEFVAATHSVLRYLADKPRTSPSPPRDRAGGTGRRAAGGGGGSDGGGVSPGQSQGSESVSPHATTSKLRQRTPTKKSSPEQHQHQQQQQQLQRQEDDQAATSTSSLSSSTQPRLAS